MQPNGTKCGIRNECPKKDTEERTWIMKRFVAIMMMLLLAVTMFACKEPEPEVEEPSVEQTEVPTEEPTAEPVAEDKTLEEKLQPVVDSVTDIMLVPTEADVTDADMMSYLFGLTDASMVEQAILAEPMIGSIPFSMGIVRVKEGGDVEAVRTAMLDGIDMRKWICVNANLLLVNNSGNDVFFVMTEDPALATSLMETFTSNVTDAGTTLERTFS